MSCIESYASAVGNDPSTTIGYLDHGGKLLRRKCGTCIEFQNLSRCTFPAWRCDMLGFQ